MPDKRPRVTTNKTLDLLALDVELGGHGLCSGEGVVVVAEGSPVTQQQLEDAVAAAPEYVEPPDPQAEFDAAVDAVDTTNVADVATKQAIEALKAAIKGTAGRAGRAAARRA